MGQNVAKDVKPLMRRARKQGFVIEHRRRHFMVTAPDGRIFGVSCSPSDPYALRKIRKDFERISYVQDREASSLGVHKTPIVPPTSIMALP